MFRHALIFIGALIASATTPAIATESVIPLTADSPKSLSSEIHTKARVWVFLSAKCPCSDSHIEKLKQAAAAYGTKGFEFVGIHANQDESVEEAETYFRKQSLGFPVFHDEGAKIANRFQALKTPHIFVESSTHQILYEGGVDDSKRASKTEANFLRDALVEISDGKPVTRTRTKSLGCVISRRKAS